MRVTRQKRQRRKNAFASLLMGLIVLGGVTGISLGIAWAWQGMEDNLSGLAGEPVSGPVSAAETAPASTSEPDKPAAVPAGDAPVIAGMSGESVIGGSDVVPAASAPLEEPSGGTPSKFRVRPEYSYALPETEEKADKSYFDDALFFGDSLSVGIPLYGIMDNAAVMAFQGINTVNINTKEAVDVLGDGNRVTMLEAAKLQYPDKTKIYVMLGGNGLDYDEDTFIGGYREFIASVKAAYPSAKVFLQSILPVTEKAYLTYPSVSNEKIDRYNLAIMELAREQKVYFVDTAAALVDDSGKLPSEASPSDGMHIGAESYHTWFDYLRAHTA